MGKKQQDETPNVNATPNRDIMQRLNFLQQASLYLQSVEATVPREEACQEPISKKFRSKKFSSGDLARSYVHCMHQVGNKTTVKMDPSVKRSLCQGCNTILIPGDTASIRLKKSRHHRHLMIYTCLQCKSTKKIPAPSVSVTPSSTQVPSDAKEAEKQLTRQPPLCARDNAGHVVFSGSRAISFGDEGPGLLFGGSRSKA